MTLEQLKYPLGKFQPPDVFTKDILNTYIDSIAKFPSKIIYETNNLTEDQLNTPYRPQGWTIRQVVHHCADSHINSLVRFKWALTEETPTIKPYEEALWAELADCKMPLAASYKILEGVHQRWVVLLNSLDGHALAKGFIHPNHGRELKLPEVIGIYAWHCNHHLAHITTLKNRKGW
ncbi:MAG TPA: putative metal-dependent hydrolase [Flavobacterium sp.]|jgi:hypothetical protein